MYKSFGLDERRKLDLLNMAWPTKKLSNLEEMGIVELGRGNVISKTTIEKNPGDYPIYSSSQQKEGEFGRYGGHMFDEELVTWSVDGGGKFFYRPKHKYSVTNVCGWMRVLKPKVLNCQFLYFALDISHRKFNFDYTFKAHPSVIRKMYNIPLPSIKIQRKIVERLDAIKKAQELNNKQIALADELFQSLLHKELNPAGKDWTMRKLGEVCEFYNGKAHEPIIIENGKYIVVNSKFISSEGEIVKYSNRNLVPLIIGDIAIVMSDIPNGKALAKCFLVNQNDKFTLNQRIGLVRTNSLDKLFLYYQLNRNKYFLRFDNGQSQTNLRKNEILNCPVFIPKITEQKQIVAKLSAVQEYKKKLLEQKQKLQELFDSVLNKSFKGE